MSERKQNGRSAPPEVQSPPVAASKRCRLLFVTESFGVGGTESHLLSLLPSLKSKGFEPAAFCFTEPGTRASALEAAAIPVAAAPRLGNLHKRSLLAPLRITGGALKLFALIGRFRPTIVHFFLPGPYLAGAPAALARGVPVKVMSRRSLADYQRNWPGAARLERRLHRHMDAVLGNSQAIVEELIKEGCPESQVRLIYNGIQPSPLMPSRAEARAALGLDEVTFVATMIANLFPYKGHRDLIAALARIEAELPKPWVLLCAGRDQGEGPALAQAIAASGLGTNVRLLGERSDVPLLLAASDVGILTPTRNEGLSNAVLESMAAGLPMVVTDVGGNSEAVADGETGFVVAAGDGAALGAAILKLAGDPALRQAMGRRAKQRVADHFSLSASIDQYCALYQELLERKMASHFGQ